MVGGFFIISILVSVISGLVHLGNSVTSQHITHFGQFFAGMTFFIVALTNVVGFICWVEE